MDAASVPSTPFIVRGATPADWHVVIAEVGPWDDVHRQLLLLQDRLYDCLDHILDGILTGAFPALKGRHIIIHLMCYDVPEDQVSEFFQRFSRGVFIDGDYAAALASQAHAAKIEFALDFASAP